MFSTAHQQLVALAVELRKRAGLSQRQLAERLGREQNYIARIETGQRRVDVVELIQLCLACGADPKVEIPDLVHRLIVVMPLHKRSGKKK
jgi:transcriptional regulator with XRE-family HTH domain